ncbi:MAG: hypothetical protein JXX28_07740 [Deltaproteobacteria bacterium]|nr:hypothetical protein [Deltaproteobacteria bacterium]
MIRDLFLMTVFLAACNGGTVDDTTTACNEANEECTASTCGGDGSSMLPGANCLACHSDDVSSEAPTFGAGGTVFADADGAAPVSGAIIRITDADGQVVELTSNAVGNFYTRTDLAMPISAEVELNGNVMAMYTTPSTAACSTCHSCGGSAGGKLFAQ